MMLWLLVLCHNVMTTDINNGRLRIATTHRICQPAFTSAVRVLRRALQIDQQQQAHGYFRLSLKARFLRPIAFYLLCCYYRLQLLLQGMLFSSIYITTYAIVDTTFIVAYPDQACVLLLLLRLLQGVPLLLHNSKASS